MKSEVIFKIKEEVEKQLKAGFLTAITYSDWVANIVLVLKKDGKVCMCIDYKDLNWASPKDNFLLLYIVPWSIIPLPTSFSPSWMGSQAIIRSRWPRKTKLRQQSPLIREPMHMMSCHLAQKMQVLLISEPW